MSDLGYCPSCGAPGVSRRRNLVYCIDGHSHDAAAFNPPAPPRPREDTVERFLVSEVTRTGGVVRKVSWPGVDGAPDRLVGWESTGRHALAEVKRPKGVAEAHQLREHRRLRAIGFTVVVLDTKEAVTAFIQEMTR